MIFKLDISEPGFCSAARAQRWLWQKLQKANKWKSYMDCDFIHGQLGPGLPSCPFHLDANAAYVPAKSHCCGPGSGSGGDDGGFQLLQS